MCSEDETEELFCYRIEDSPGYSYYVARSESDALELHQSFNGLTEDEIIEESCFIEHVADDYELTVQIDLTKESKETKTVREWIEIEGRGILTVPGWLLE